MELKHEYKLFIDRYEEFEREHANEYVLIKNKEVDFFRSDLDALKIGIERYGNVPFLVKKVCREYSWL